MPGLRWEHHQAPAANQALPIPMEASHPQTDSTKQLLTISTTTLTGEHGSKTGAAVSAPAGNISLTFACGCITLKLIILHVIVSWGAF